MHADAVSERVLENVMGVWWFAVGAGVGLAIGEANHRAAMGLALGVALGAVIDRAGAKKAPVVMVNADRRAHGRAQECAADCALTATIELQRAERHPADDRADAAVL